MTAFVLGGIVGALVVWLIRVVGSPVIIAPAEAPMPEALMPGEIVWCRDPFTPEELALVERHRAERATLERLAGIPERLLPESPVSVEADIIAEQEARWDTERAAPAHGGLPDGTGHP